MAVAVGSFEAKTKFAELLRNVEQGMIYSITRNGKPVALLQGAASANNDRYHAAYKRIVDRAEKLPAFSLSEIKELKSEGRKY